MSPGLRVTVGALALVLVFGGLLFGSAGRFDVPAFYAYVGLWLAQMVGTYAALARRHPDLIEERAKPPSDRDRATRAVSMLPAMGHLVLAGLDARWGLTHVPLAAQTTAFVVLAAGLWFVTWTLTTNRFASTAVRIQQERGQTVITHGPYAIVRHPMYLGVVLVSLSGGVALGSWWSALALCTLVPVFLRRTAKEDRMLHDELDGYREYAARVRHRVLPFVY